MQLLKKLYRAVVSDDLRWRMWIYRDRNSENGVLRREILDYYAKLPDKEKNKDVNEVLQFVNKYGVATFPYTFSHRYKPNDVKVLKDEKSGLHYVLQDGKRLYYKRSLSVSEIQDIFTFLSIEQHEHSPHRYLTKAFDVKEGDVIADIGAAEGNFSLSVVEKAGKIYIFEADPEWIEALEATFAPWQDKVQVVNKYVSNTVDQKNVTLDHFMQDKAKVDFIKVDVEGAEALILEGAHKVLEQDIGLKVALCTYHKQKDSKELANILEQHHFHITYSEGYMLFLDDKQSPPYFRKGLIRAYK